MAFVHLHTHTAYSLLDGEGTISKIIDAAKAHGQTAMAITDHGVMYGVIDFYEYAKKQGIKPVLGCEVYTAARSRRDKVHEHDSQSGHLILLAKNNKGYQNLMNIVSIGFTEGFYYKPRIDMPVLRKNSEGLIALSACMYGDVAQFIINNNYNGAKEKAQEFINIFGKENFFIEIQDHGLIEQKRLNKELIKLARELDLKVVATNDIHYVNRRDAEYQDILMAIQTGKTLADEDRMKFENSEMYVKSEEEMLELFLNISEAIDNTQYVADLCNVEIEFGKLHLPEYKVPDDYTAASYLKELCYRGFSERYPNDDGDVREKLEYELGMIEKMGYVDYFLIVWDFIKYARDNGIMVGPGRGSAAGSVVSYCLYITNVDPVEYSLIFERFLNPERISMPDIDIDFCYERRQEVIDYVISKYGEDRVTQIITFGTMAARGAIRDVGRVLNIPYGVVDSVAKLVPFELGMTIEKALYPRGKEAMYDIHTPLRQKYEGDDNIKKLIDTAKELEGLPRHASTHAAGVVITKEPVYKYVPLHKKDDVITTQFPMGTIEKLGLLKMDFLGLRTLTVIRDTVLNVKQAQGIDVDINSINYADKAVYSMLSSGNTDGMFQLESSGMKQFMKELKPQSLEDIIAGISLYRPGPMDSIPRYVENKNNLSKITYKHPKLESILDVTYGCIVYQEQVMQIVRELGGYSLGRADLVRRAMSKKKADVMEKEKQNFIYGIVDKNGNIEVDGAIRRGIDEKTAESIFDEMMSFAAYAFNKSHAAAYAVIAYQTAYLKVHYPTEFMAALLSSVIDRTNQVTRYITECRKYGIKVFPPDINKSRQNFIVDDGAIRFGLVAVKNVGNAFIHKMLEERDKNGVFKSFTDFCARMSDREINKRVVEALIRSGAFDNMGLKRSVLINEYENAIDYAVGGKKTNVLGQMDLFGSLSEAGSVIDEFTDREEFSHKEILEMEKESMGFYISGHPLDEYKEIIEQTSTCSTLDIFEASQSGGGLSSQGGEVYDKATVTVTGIIIKKRNKSISTGTMSFITLEDFEGTVEIIVWPDRLVKYESLLEENKMAVITGRLEIKEDDTPKIICENVQSIDLAKSSGSKLYLQLNSTDKYLLSQAMEVVKMFSGDIPVHIYYKDINQQSVAKRENWTSANDEMLKRLGSLLGVENVRLITQKENA